jgi:hypothetical protein
MSPYGISRLILTHSLMYSIMDGRIILSMKAVSQTHTFPFYWFILAFIFFVLVGTVVGLWVWDYDLNSAFEDLIQVLLFVVLPIFFIILLGYAFAHAEFLQLELILSLITVGILVAFCTTWYYDALFKARSSEFFSLAGGAKNSLIEYYSYHGTWPGAELLPHIKTEGKYITHLHTEEGVISAMLRENGWHLSLRPMWVEEPAKIIPWLCGYAEVPDGLIVQGRNQTTLPPLYLLHFCRN